MDAKFWSRREHDRRMAAARQQDAIVDSLLLTMQEQIDKLKATAAQLQQHLTEQAEDDGGHDA